VEAARLAGHPQQRRIVEWTIGPAEVVRRLTDIDGTPVMRKARANAAKPVSMTGERDTEAPTADANIIYLVSSPHDTSRT